MNNTLSKNNIINDIQVLRAIAVFIVLLGHNYVRFVYEPAWNLLSKYVGTWTGVDIFFAISGYVITNSFLKSLDRVRDGQLNEKILVTVLFWFRRIFRIWPSAIFWAVTGVVVPLTFDANSSPTFAIELISASWAAIIQVANLHQANFIIANGHWTHGAIFWSLSTEEQFYIIFPFIICFLNRRFIVPALIAIAVVQAPYQRNADHNVLLFFFRTDAISYGVLIALFRRNILDHSPKLTEVLTWLVSSRVTRYLLVPLSLATIFFLPTGFIALPQSTALIAIFAGLLVFLASFNQNVVLPIPYIHKILLWMGARSYSIYLCQIPYVSFFDWCLRGPNNPALCSCHHRRPLLAATATFYAPSSSVTYHESSHGRAGYRKLTRQTIGTC